MPVCPVCLLVEWRLAPLAIQAKHPAKVISATLALAFGNWRSCGGVVDGNKTVILVLNHRLNRSMRLNGKTWQIRLEDMLVSIPS